MSDDTIWLPVPHQATLDLLRWFDSDHLPAHLQAVSQPFQDLAIDLTAFLRDGPELSAGLRKLLEAKDCFVRQAVLAHREATAALEEIG
jgi:hypothetical protein